MVDEGWKSRAKRWLDERRTRVNHPGDAAIRAAKKAERSGDATTAMQLNWRAAQSYVDDADYPRAADALRQAIRISPAHADLHYALAEVLTRLGQSEDAATAYRAAADHARAEGRAQWAEELQATAEALSPTHEFSALMSPAGTLTVAAPPSSPSTERPTAPPAKPDPEYIDRIIAAEMAKAFGDES